MKTIPLWAYVLVMALVTYAIRATPFVLFRRKIRSRFVKSLLAYIPYAVLAAMTIPGIFYSTSSVPSAVCGCVVAAGLALWGRSLLTVAAGACVAAYVAEFLISHL